MKVPAGLDTWMTKGSLSKLTLIGPGDKPPWRNVTNSTMQQLKLEHSNPRMVKEFLGRQDYLDCQILEEGHPWNPTITEGGGLADLSE